MWCKIFCGFEYPYVGRADCCCSVAHAVYRLIIKHKKYVSCYLFIWLFTATLNWKFNDFFLRTIKCLSSVVIRLRNWRRTVLVNKFSYIKLKTHQTKMITKLFLKNISHLMTEDCISAVAAWAVCFHFLFVLSKAYGIPFTPEPAWPVDVW